MSGYSKAFSIASLVLLLTPLLPGLAQQDDLAPPPLPLIPVAAPAIIAPAEVAPTIVLNDQWQVMTASDGHRISLDKKSIAPQDGPFVRYTLLAEMLQSGQVAAEIRSAHTANCGNGYDQVNATTFRSLDGPDEALRQEYTTKTPFKSGLQPIVRQVCQDAARIRSEKEAARIRLEKEAARIRSEKEAARVRAAQAAAAAKAKMTQTANHLPE